MIYAGACECGNVAYEANAPVRAVTVCHCGQCLRTSGHSWASVTVPLESLKITKDGGLKWFTSSNFARRGFCTGCGSSLFFEPFGKDRVAIGAGTLTQPTGLKTGKHVFTADKGDYYDIACTAPQFAHYE